MRVPLGSTPSLPVIGPYYGLLVDSLKKHLFPPIHHSHLLALGHFSNTLLSRCQKGLKGLCWILCILLLSRTWRLLSPPNLLARHRHGKVNSRFSVPLWLKSPMALTCDWNDWYLWNLQPRCLVTGQPLKRVCQLVYRRVPLLPLRLTWGHHIVTLVVILQAAGQNFFDGQEERLGLDN